MKICNICKIEHGCIKYKGFCSNTCYLKNWRLENPNYEKEYKQSHKKQRSIVRREHYKYHKTEIQTKAKLWLKKDPLREKKYNLKRNYNITLEDYNNFLKKQNNKCAICEKNFNLTKKKEVHVDHCHKTKKVRGLLCHACNTSLGGFKENIAILEKAIVYLKLFQGD